MVNPIHGAFGFSAEYSNSLYPLEKGRPRRTGLALFPECQLHLAAAWRNAVGRCAKQRICLRRRGRSANQAFKPFGIQCGRYRVSVWPGLSIELSAGFQLRRWSMPTLKRLAI